MNLSELRQDQKAVIIKIKGRGGFRKRIQEMGFVFGRVVSIVKKAPLKDPVEYEIMGYKVSLRNSEAALIEVFVCGDNVKDEHSEFNGTIDTQEESKKDRKNPKSISVVFVGNPNSGKTTLFNEASGAHQKVGNYSGVTVEAHRSRFKWKGFEINMVDLPGSYSITSLTPEEVFIRDFLLNEIPDVVVNVLDASNLERNLFLTTQLIDLDIKVVVALNMFDELQQQGDVFDYETLGKMIGIPFIPTIGSKGKGVAELMDKIVQVFEDKEENTRHVHINYGSEIEKAIVGIQQRIKIPENIEITSRVSPRFMAIQLLARDTKEIERVKQMYNGSDVLSIAEKESGRLEKEFKNSMDTLITELKYGFIAGALLETYKPGENKGFKKTDLIDIVVTHKVFGYPIFFAFMWFTFWATYTIGAYPMHWIEKSVKWFSEIIEIQLPAGIFKDLLLDGIISGVGGVLVFMPNILLLFFFISVMEDTGYMARSVFIMDKVMHKIGLHGKSFIPLLMGFGCNVPAILATRTLENKNDRIITMLINPFMSCSARLPVYILIIGLFFRQHAGFVLLMIYSLGILVAVSASLILKRTMFRVEKMPFVMELPPYRLPTLKSITRHMWDKGVQYLRKISGVILLASVIIWALGYFPKSDVNQAFYQSDAYKQYQILALELTQAQQQHPGLNSDSLHIRNVLEEQEESAKQAYQLEHSYIGRIGKFLQPAMAPLGFDWKMTISVLAGIPAKEVIVSTMNVLYQKKFDMSPTISEQKSNRKEPSPNSGMNPRNGLSFMIFVLLYFPCLGTLVAIAKESGSWKWSVFSLLYSSAIAWTMAFLVNFVSRIIL